MKSTRNLGIALILLGWLLIFLGIAHGAELKKEFVHAIHWVETGGREGRIIGDNGKALGPLQIHYIYWLDSRVQGKYENCTNLNYSVKVMTAYLNRYAPQAVRTNGFEILARTHNGGPSGPQKPSTRPYWLKVKSHL